MTHTPIKFIFSVLVTAAIAIALTGCGGGNANNASSSPPASSASSSAASGEVKAFTIEATNWAFEPAEITVNRGDTVSITLNNKKGNHALKIEGYEQEVKGGETITFTADQAGEFVFKCSIMCGSGHADMAGKLIVL